MTSLSKMKLFSLIAATWLALGLMAPACVPATPFTPTAALSPSGTVPATALSPTKTFLPQVTSTAAGGSSQVPNFSHVLIMIFENTEYSSVAGSSAWPEFNQLAKQYALLTRFYAVTHPSLPNYIALTSGSTQGITSDCTTCFVNAVNLPDQVETSGRTWKAYLESMPSACRLGDAGNYAQKHNPFVYYNDIRTNLARCQNHDVPLTQLDSDLANHTLPDFAWITPDLCNDAHNCPASTADSFLAAQVSKILGSASFDQDSLLVILFDEGSTNASCCGLSYSAGGNIAALLISSLVKPGFQDPTPYSHYSLLKTIEKGWNLPYLGYAADAATSLISAPWK
jgi:phospholipase C